MPRLTTRLLAAITTLVMATSACTDAPVEESRPVPLLVFAAASLTDAFADLEVAFEATNPAIDIRINVAASSALREQILQGAPADVFASANPSTMAAVVDAGLTAGEAVVFVRNTLSLAVPIGNPGGVAGLDDLARGGLLVGLCAKQTPCGTAAAQVLSNAGIDASVDTYEPTVRSLLTKIEQAELDVGLVYATDVVSTDLVEGIDIPDGWAVESSYLIASLEGSSAPEAAAAFVALVLSAEGQSILTSRGFLSP